MYILRTATPAGTLTTIADDDHTVLAAGFAADPAELATRLGLAAAPPSRIDGPVALAIGRYLDGDLDALDDVPVAQPGTPFQQQVWTALRQVPPGEPATYGEIADRIGRPGATRAVGSACGRNLVAPYVPCHRAVRADGSAGGYLYGPDVKGWLLAHEAGHR